MLTILVPISLLGVGAALLVRDRRLASEMTLPERKRGQENVRRLYFSWRFLAALASAIIALASLLSRLWIDLVVALVACAVTVPQAVERWRSLQRQS